jgi:TRAP-type C4-dicarboxylate transport system substrate-binding protein
MIGSKTFAAVLITGLAFFTASGAQAASKPRAKVEIKIATIATDGSTWMKIMDQLDSEIREKTAGEVGLKFYPGGVQGDDSVVLKKIRAGQLHGGGFTGVGLGEIAPGLRVLEVPFTLRSVEEVHAVRERMGPELEQMLSDAGFELLGWADVGFVYLFTKEPVASIADLKRVKMWLWEGDPLAETLLRTVGVSPVPLPITDVVTSLQTGMIDGVYTSPMGCISLQWFTRVGYMTDLPVTHANGAVVVTRKIFDQLSPSAQAIVKDSAKKYFTMLNEATGKEGDASLVALKDRGIKVVALNEADKGEFDSVGKTVREKLVGTLYTQALLDRTLQTLADVRSGKGGSTP